MVKNGPSDLVRRVSFADGLRCVKADNGYPSGRSSQPDWFQQWMLLRSVGELRDGACLVASCSCVRIKVHCASGTANFRSGQMRRCSFPIV